MSNRLASELGFWSWLGRRAREWLKSPSAAAFVCLAAGLTLAACDILLFVAGEPRPILFGEGAWAVTAYGIAALPLVAIGFLLMLYDWYSTSVKRGSGGQG